MADKIKICKMCGNYCVDDNVIFVLNKKRDKSLLCIVEEVSDLWAIERGKIFNGLYFVLGGTLNAIKGVTPEKLNTINYLKDLKKKK